MYQMTNQLDHVIKISLGYMVIKALRLHLKFAMFIGWALQIGISLPHGHKIVTLIGLL
jgi:hypothetical protein